MEKSVETLLVCGLWKINICERRIYIYEKYLDLKVVKKYEMKYKWVVVC